MEEQYFGWGSVMEEEEERWRKGPWTAEEDRLLFEYVKFHGEGRWNSVAKLTGLKRKGKSCRLRWVNYLRPDLKRGQITPDEENIILELHARWGNRWSAIARSLPGRTDNDIKNYWRTHFKNTEKSVSTNSHENATARLLRRQQFQQQLQQQKYQQYQQQQQQQKQQQLTTELDIKMIMSLLDENENIVQSLQPHDQERQDMATLNPNSTTEDYQVLFSPHISGYAEDPSEDSILWDGGLWNLGPV